MPKPKPLGKPVDCSPCCCCAAATEADEGSSSAKTCFCAASSKPAAPVISKSIAEASRSSSSSTGRLAAADADTVVAWLPWSLFSNEEGGAFSSLGTPPLLVPNDDETFGAIGSVATWVFDGPGSSCSSPGCVASTTSSPSPASSTCGCKEGLRTARAGGEDSQETVRCSAPSAGLEGRASPSASSVDGNKSSSPSFSSEGRSSPVSAASISFTVDVSTMVSRATVVVVTPFSWTMELSS
ncbi:hypothetical protein BKA80DRAFT_270684 [Phyllosticta citrichinensis]